MADERRGPGKRGSARGPRQQGRRPRSEGQRPRGERRLPRGDERTERHAESRTERPAQGKTRARTEGKGRGRSEARGPGRPEDRRRSRPNGKTQRRGTGGGQGRTGAKESARGQAQPSPAAASAPVRLQVFLARAGVASRRASEELISSGRVSVNGKTVTEMGTRVRPDEDRIYVDGKRVETNPPVWIALNKPKGFVTTREDPSGRKTIYDLLPRELHHLFHVGRLDRKSEGLLLLTNEGTVAHRLLHPRYGVTKEYAVVVEGIPEYETLEQLVQGVEVEGETLYAESVELVGLADKESARLRLVLREGRNREVRRMLEAVGHPVTRLARKRFGPIALGKLRRGEWRPLSPAEVDDLRAEGREGDRS